MAMSRAATWAAWPKSFQGIVHAAEKKLPRGSSIIVRGQVETMRSSFLGLGLGLLFAIALVYLLIVMNFQSWSDPFIIITALPGALCGIVWMLFLTRTTLNVPSLMGAVMSIGVATSNSILVVTFAKERLAETRNAFTAALDAGYIRLRPVVMTALAMIIGMVPMALGLGEGGEQNAPLGRAVIGGLLFATVATLFFVPVVFCMIRSRSDVESNGGASTGNGARRFRTYEANGNRIQHRSSRFRRAARSRIGGAQRANPRPCPAGRTPLFLLGGIGMVLAILAGITVLSRSARARGIGERHPGEPGPHGEHHPSQTNGGADRA